MEKRLSRIEKQIGGPERHQVAICEQCQWPPSAWEELMAADNLGDREGIADLAERYANCRPVFDNGSDIAVVISHSGPPGDEAAAVLEATRIIQGETP